MVLRRPLDDSNHSSALKNIMAIVIELTKALLLHQAVSSTQLPGLHRL